MDSSDSDEENVIRYGTPLEPYEEDEVPSKKKFQQQPDQYAVDEHGRRRFHGAFTGGFSAGFGNTVGTPEGWTPSTFKSSRSEKAQGSTQRPEDFMDEEDRGEFGIAPRFMQTHSEFSGQKRPRPKQFHDGPIPGEPVLEQLVVAVHESAAVRMLRGMGWRAGQGAGGRVSRAERRRARGERRVYGCYVPAEMRQETQKQSDEDSSDSDSEFDYDTLFAPEDYEPYLLANKSDRFGIGYSGLSRHSVLGNLTGEYGSRSSKSHLVMKEKGKKVSIRGQAFGVGAFEADDEDIYATEDMSHYDFTLGGASSDNKTKKIKEKSAGVLEGFVKSSSCIPPVPSYPPPALPRHYTPLAAGTRRSRFAPSDAPQRDQGLGRHELTADARGALLGETPLPKLPQPPPQEPPPETTTKDPIAALLGRNVNFVTTNEQTPDFISIKDSGKELTKVFKPFATNPQKQARYEKFLKGEEVVRDGAIDKLKEWERDREMMEFEQAAKLYRPLTGDMGDRFTHASQPDDAINPLTAVAKSATNYGLATPEQIEAAKSGVYGLMTRLSSTWRPEPLVCKRFNVPEVGGGRPEQRKEDKPKVSYSIFSYLESSVHDKESFAKEQTKFSGSKSTADVITKHSDTNTKKTEASTSNTTTIQPTTNNENASTSVETGFKKRMTVAEMFLKESEKDLKKDQNEVVDTINKFDKMDLYKSIFLSDSENDEEIVEKEVETRINFDYLDTPRNVERNTSPPKGIFANIDFDEINSWKRNAEAKKPDTNNINKDSNTEKAQVEIEEDIYGPKIPENLLKRLEAPKHSDNFKPIFRSKKDIEEDVQVISSSSDSWVDAKEAKSKKPKKVKKSKKHKSKKKSKHKKKDR